MINAEKMRLKTIRNRERIKKIQEKEKQEALSIAVLSLNERIKTAAKQGKYFAEMHLDGLDASQKEILQKYYLELGYSVNMQSFYWITVSWEDKNE